MFWQMRRVRLFAWLLVVLSWQSYAQTATAQATAAKPKTGRFLMWKVTSPTATVYLVGSIHLAKKEIYPLPAPVEAAFKSAQVLAVEIDIRNADQTKAMQIIQQYGMYGPDDALSKHLSPETSAALDEFCKNYGMPRANLERMKPWVVSLLAAATAYMKTGADPKSGIDMHFLNELAAPQRVQELESVDFQVKLLSSASEQEQEQALASGLKSVAQAAEMESDYLNGNTEGMLKRLDTVGSKAYVKRLVEDRNVGMAEKVDAMLKGKETCFVVVGMAHIIGDKGVAKLLQDRNYKVEPTALEW